MDYKLYMMLIGCRPPGRLTEQHDVFFGIAATASELVSQVKSFWPEAKGKLHVDAWRAVTEVGGYAVRVVQRAEMRDKNQLFFINLGGYRTGEFEEYHHKVLVVAESIAEAKKQAKQSVFFKTNHLPGAGAAHIDDKYGIDVDDAHRVADILPATLLEQFSIEVTPGATTHDALHIGYLPLAKLAMLSPGG